MAELAARSVLRRNFDDIDWVLINGTLNDEGRKRLIRVKNRLLLQLENTPHPTRLSVFLTWWASPAGIGWTIGLLTTVCLPVLLKAFSG